MTRPIRAALAAALALTLAEGCDAPRPAATPQAPSAHSQAAARVERAPPPAPRLEDGAQAGGDGGAAAGEAAREAGPAPASEREDAPPGAPGSATSSGEGDPAMGDGESPRTYPITAGSDLEYNAGFPEPDQQPVAPAPPTWSPPADEGAQAGPAIEAVTPDRGPAGGGVQVTIRGKNLDRVSQVLFGVTPAEILGATADAVTVSSPAAGAGPVAIAVTTRDGGYAIAAMPFRFGE